MNEEDDDGDRSGVSMADEVNIQDVIRGRKEERRLQAEEKRQVDLQRIRDMMSTTGIEPLDQFPKEIWVKILDDLDPEDKGNVWNVHPLFRDLMEEIRIRDILFPQVIKLQAFRSNYDNFESEAQEQLRCISKSTKNSFDHWIDNKLTKDIHEAQADSSCYDDLLANISLNVFNGSEILESLLNSFVHGGEQSGKHFFPRELSVSFMDYGMETGDDDILEVFDKFKDVTALLKAIGKQVWHFRVFVELDTITFPDMYILLQGWACLMPNLKWLEVSIHHSFQIIGSSNEAQSALQSHPFPRLSHLERLSFHTGYHAGLGKGTFLNIYQVILGANQHIKMLDLTDEDSYPKIPPASLTQSLQLTRFTICDEDYCLRSNLSTLGRIQPIVNYNWPLKTICLGLFADYKGQPLSFVIRVLQHFPLLEKVKLIQLESFHVGDTDKFGYLKLPNLTEFEMELTDPEINCHSNIHFFFSLQFLLECKNLQKISWKLTGFNYLGLREHLRQYERANYVKIIDFRGGLKYLYDSNIWKVFPSLNTLNVRIRRDSPSRECHHEYLRADIENMSVRRFLREHSCSSSTSSDLRFCAMLVN